MAHEGLNQNLHLFHQQVVVFPHVCYSFGCFLLFKRKPDTWHPTWPWLGKPPLRAGRDLGTQICLFERLDPRTPYWKVLLLQKRKLRSLRLARLAHPFQFLRRLRLPDW